MNRYARTLSELEGEEHDVVERAVEAACRTFGQVAEKEGSHYHVGSELSPEETWRRLAEEVGRVSAIAAIEGSLDVTVGVDDVELIHAAIFQPVFRDRVLSFRAAKYDTVDFPVYVGTPERLDQESQQGVGPRHHDPEAAGR